MNVAEQPSSEAFLEGARAALFTSLADHLDRLTWDAARLQAFQTERLRALLAHAVTRSPFHAERLGHVDPERFELTDLSHLPVMDKATMMEQFDEVVTDRRLRRTHLEQLVEATVDMPIPALGEYLILTSGGSSGIRGIFVLDAPAVAEFYASVMRPNIARMASEPSTASSTMAIFAAASPIHATGLSALLLEGGPAHITTIPATLPFTEIVARVHTLEPGHALLGYPSVLARLAEEQLAGHLRLEPVSVATTSENLQSETRALIEQAFDVPVIDTFGSSEGLVGVSAPGEEVLTFASDCCIVELVDADDQPVEPGRPSASVLVTNLYNRTQPVIRYRMEDRFAQEAPAADHGHLRATVDGRTGEILRWGDVVVHPLAIVNELLLTPAVVDYVVRQTASGVEIDVVARDEIDLTALTERITHDLVDAGLRDPEVVLRAIDEAPRNPRTGKVARIVTFEPAP